MFNYIIRPLLDKLTMKDRANFLDGIHSTKLFYSFFFCVLYGINNRTYQTNNNYNKRNVNGHMYLKIFYQHFKTYKNEYNSNSLLQVFKLVYSAFQQEE